VTVGGGTAGDGFALALTRALDKFGVETRYLGSERDAAQIAAAVADTGSDAVELCLAGDRGGVLVIRALLRELSALGRRDVSIVVHRVT
jgi:methylmalonyl-CoA mutase cobalamin-binding subunit